MRLPRPLLHDQFTSRGRGRVVRIACTERGQGDRHAVAGVHAVPPPPHLDLHTAVYPCSECVANAAHADKSGGYVGKPGGGGGGTQGVAVQDRRKGGAHANTVCSAPPSSGMRGKGSNSCVRHIDPEIILATPRGQANKLRFALTRTRQLLHYIVPGINVPILSIRFRRALCKTPRMSTLAFATWDYTSIVDLTNTSTITFD